MTKELYEQTKTDIPAHIGVYIGSTCIRKAKKQSLGIDEHILKNSMIRSLFRVSKSQVQSGIPSVIEGMERRLRRFQNDADKYRQKYHDINREIICKYGTQWNKS